jgi:hypothetical protein
VTALGVAKGLTWQNTRTDLLVANAALLSLHTRKVPKRGKSKKRLFL